ncbi:hypothetical protein ACHAXA_011738 [Cyclostephanos tholiformis]|uniref:Neurotransmitter-gated ion-channel ligand-binding domain-containing protein n=1 Tax=Cyclostephanos tholiformis TaxID=382380 RepID=A0ABD3R637_9STRA
MIRHRPSISRGMSFSMRRSTLHKDVSEFSESYDPSTEPVGLDMGGHDTHLLGPKTVMLDSFVIDLLHVDTGAQTFRLKLLVNMDWEDDGTIEPEMKHRRNLGRRGSGSGGDGDVYRTGKYVPRREYREDPLSTTWNPNVVLVNAIADESPVEAGSKFHSINMLNGRPVVSRSVIYQPTCRCAFSFANFPFDETDLVVKLSSNKWNSEQVHFMWSHRLSGGGNHVSRDASHLRRSVDSNAVGGIGLSEFEIVTVRVTTGEKEVDCMSRYDNAEGEFSEAHLVIRVRRDPYSYLLRVASVAELLMFLEVLSFLTHDDDLCGRFSISGTIFLAMVSLYGPMADSLPKVSVVTRVDKWHVQNFILLFASNVENLVACVFRKYIETQYDDIVESILAIIYMYLVAKNLFWFIEPLKEREDYALLLKWYEVRAEYFWDEFRRFISMIRHPWTVMSWNKKAEVNKVIPHDGGKTKLALAAWAVQALCSWEREARLNNEDQLKNEKTI